MAVAFVGLGLLRWNGKLRGPDGLGNADRRCRRGPEADRLRLEDLAAPPESL
jgi:hypothetical protein